jgi:hypothetical protein
MPGRFRYLPLDVIDRWIELMESEGVSKVARSRRGFLAAYEKAGGDPAALSPWWRQRRDNFVARHMAQAKANDERLWVDGLPSRRHLALIAWAYSPTPSRV